MNFALADWTFTVARLAPLIMMVVCLVLLVRLPRDRRVGAQRDVISLCCSGCLADGALFGEVGRKASVFAYFWAVFLLFILGFLAVRSYRAARRMATDEAGGVSA